MNWLSARSLVLAGQTVARSVWMDRFLYRSADLYLLQCYDPVTGALGAKRVVQTGDFGIKEFQAQDWVQHGAAAAVVVAPAPPIYVTRGCTNPLALNYNPLAVLDDGTCNLEYSATFSADVDAWLYLSITGSVVTDTGLSDTGYTEIGGVYTGPGTAAYWGLTHSFMAVHPAPTHCAVAFISGRDSSRVYVSQQPSAVNGYQTQVIVDDETAPAMGDSIYHFKLTWS